MKSSTSDKIKKRTNANDKFYTPVELVKVHLEYVKDYVEEDDIILDPFFGTGNYFNSFKSVFEKNTWDYTEIDLGLDFFKYDKKINVIVSNPPYSMIDKVLEKSVELKPHTISYLIGQHNLTNKRIEYMNANGYYLDKLFLTKIYKWYGMSIMVVFTTKSKKNCIDFDRKVWQTDS
jgi:type I restriction-modification system DNA methylase subunit